MLHITEAGVVAAPTVLQVRLEPDGDAPVRVGWPRPSRSVDVDTLLRHVAAFTVERRGPRTVACETLVLSGVPTTRVAEIAGVLPAIRAMGILRVVLHDESGPRGWSGLDAVVRRVAGPEDVDALRAWTGVHRTAVIRLDRGAPRALDALGRDGPADRLVLTWPWHGPDEALRPEAVPALLDGLAVGAVPVEVKGVPACLLGAHARRSRRTGNRFHVDGDVAVGSARLFKPDRVRFGRPDVCRACAALGRCDGVPPALVDRRVRPLPGEPWGMAG